MKNAVLLAVAAASMLTAGAAFADPTVARSTPGVLQLDVHVIYGRPNRPMVIIDMKTPTAASAAGAAHETMHGTLLDRAEPAAMRSR